MLKSQEIKLESKMLPYAAVLLDISDNNRLSLTN